MGDVTWAQCDTGLHREWNGTALGPGPGMCGLWSFWQEGLAWEDAESDSS